MLVQPVLRIIPCQSLQQVVPAAPAAGNEVEVPRRIMRQRRVEIHRCIDCTLWEPALSCFGEPTGQGGCRFSTGRNRKGDKPRECDNFRNAGSTGPYPVPTTLPRSKNTPVLTGYRKDGQLHVWCPFCISWHRHGATDGRRVMQGHRVAHCPGGPFKETGYFIRPFTRAESEQIRGGF